MASNTGGVISVCHLYHLDLWRFWRCVPSMPSNYGFGGVDDGGGFSGIDSNFGETARTTLGNDMNISNVKVMRTESQIVY